MNTRHLERRVGVDAGDVGMGMRRAHDSGMELIDEFEIVEKAALPPPMIFRARPKRVTSSLSKRHLTRASKREHRAARGLILPTLRVTMHWK